MDMQSAISRVIANQDLSGAEMQAVMRIIMQGAASPAQIGGFLTGLRMKGETVEEIAAAAGVMRELASRVAIDYPHMVDIVGTGGDGSHTFNISTVAAFVVAAAGGRVAKHGNRAASSKSGSADVLEAAGVNIELSPEQVARCVEQVGIGFMFAARHHSAMKHAIGPRRELGTRTIFNLLGPLTNPAGVKNQLIGVYAIELIRPVAEVLQRLGSEHIMVVHAADGLDEISIAAPTHVAELKDGKVTTWQISPEQFGLATAGLDSLRVESAAQSLEIVNAVLDNQPGPARDIVLLNAGAAIYTAGLAGDMAAGVNKADEVIASGAARHKLDELIAFTRSLAE
jgi:anthranilate phosphoribosyltransferase